MIIGRCWNCNHILLKESLFIYSDKLRKDNIEHFKKGIIGKCKNCDVLLSVSDLFKGCELKIGAKELNLMLYSKN